MVGLAGLIARPAVRSALIAFLCLTAAAVYFATVADAYPIKDWLFWRMVVLWGWCAYFQIGCVSLGHLILTRALKMEQVPTLEKLVVSMALGVVAFTIAMYVGGAIHLYRAWFAIALPIAMFLPGAPALWRLIKSSRERMLSAPPARLGPWATAAIVGGVLCLALVYLQCMTPSALTYDARWYHLPIAEDYAREGRIVPFLADYNKAYPQLSSLLFTWAWLLPGLDLGRRCMLALHIEFFLFVWTLAGIGAVVAWLVDRARVPGSWAAFFLFPIIFVYDSNIGAGADHVLAFFTPPLFLAAVRAIEDLSPRRCALVGAVGAGAVLTKYQALYMLVPVSAIIGGGWLALVRQHRRGAAKAATSDAGIDWSRLWLGPAMLLAVGTVLTLPHFLKNWIYYHNPFFPFALGTFKGTTPSQPDSALLITGLFHNDSCIPRGTPAEMLRTTWDNIHTFFFRSPYAFGLIFPLILPLVPFVRGGRRLWIATGVAVCGYLVWAFTYPIERYLQAIVPMFAAVVAGVVLCAWREGWLARLGVLALLGTQIIWGGDELFYSGFGRMDDAVAMIRGGHEGQAEHRFERYLTSQAALARSLPANAVVLFHNTRVSLGVNRKVLQDLPGFQGLISYRHVRTARELVELYRSFGITHIVQEPGTWPTWTRQEEVVIAAFRARHAHTAFSEGEYEVIELPAELPPVEAPYRVQTIGMPGYADGVYAVETLNVYEPMPGPMKQYPAPSIAAPEGSPQSLTALETVDAVLVNTDQTLSQATNAVLNQQFAEVINYAAHGHIAVYVRK
jgi:hypothetical protein